MGISEGRGTRTQLDGRGGRVAWWGIALLAASGTLLGASGCGLLKPKPMGKKKKEKKQQQQGKSQGGSSAPKPAGLAGEWTRASDKARFQVKDDGSVVKGTLIKGSKTTKSGAEFYAQYSFELKREGGAIKGKATFALADYPKDVYTSAWEVEREGDTIRAQVEALTLDDEGKVTKREKEAASFAFKGKAPAPAPTSVSGGGYKMDLTTIVKAPGRLVLGKEAAIGMQVQLETVAGGRTMAHSLAIVGEEGDSWRVESTQGLSAYAAMSPDAKDMVLGLLVAKADGKVTRARLGKAGEAGKQVGISPAGAAGQAQKGPEGQDVEVELSFGKLPAKKYVTGGMTSYVGVEGEAQGVLLKLEGGAGAKALKQAPSKESVKLGALEVEVRKALYDNGEELWQSTHPVVKALNYGLVKSKTKYATLQVKSASSEAKAQLKW